MLTASLTLYDRYFLLQLIDTPEGNLVTMRLLRDLQSKVGYSGEELEAHIKTANGQTSFGANPAKELQFAPAEVTFIQERLRPLAENGSIQRGHLALFDAFLPDGA